MNRLAQYDAQIAYATSTLQYCDETMKRMRPAVLRLNARLRELAMLAHALVEEESAVMYQAGVPQAPPLAVTVQPLPVLQPPPPPPVQPQAVLPQAVLQQAVPPQAVLPPPPANDTAAL